MSVISFSLDDQADAALAVALVKAVMSCDKRVKLAMCNGVLKETSPSRRPDLLRAMTGLEFWAAEPYDREQRDLAEHDAKVKRNRIEGIRESRTVRAKQKDGNDQAA